MGPGCPVKGCKVASVRSVDHGVSANEVVERRSVFAPVDGEVDVQEEIMLEVEVAIEEYCGIFSQFSPGIGNGLLVSSVVVQIL